MEKIVIITGLTCSGKSELALKIAKEYNGEIISADSVQIYRGLDIGSAKESKSIRDKVPHHLIDIVNFDEKFNVSQFVDECTKAIKLILSRKHLPIIVGGTGLYVKALIEGYNFSNIEGNLKFRQKLEELANKEGNKAVWDILNVKNPQKASTVHFNNLKRVIRYIEIEEFGTAEEVVKPLANYDILTIGVIADREQIYKKINARVEHMLALGLEEEIKNLLSLGATREMQSMNSIGYKEWFDYFDGKTDFNTTIDLIKQHSRNYCKRQLTFLKTLPSAKLCEIDEAEREIRSFLDDRDK